MRLRQPSSCPTQRPHVLPVLTQKTNYQVGIRWPPGAARRIAARRFGSHEHVLDLGLGFRSLSLLTRLRASSCVLCCRDTLQRGQLCREISEYSIVPEMCSTSHPKNERGNSGTVPLGPTE
ncbi:hypothetical protein IF2G_09454 [Cordyceps javanica]|nr:hypothetical protein IF2G_09454 [Cordyceps javanica]